LEDHPWATIVFVLFVATSQDPSPPSSTKKTARCACHTPVANQSSLVFNLCLQPLQNWIGTVNSGLQLSFQTTNNTVLFFSLVYCTSKSSN
jgi:hypothetical protein